MCQNASEHANCFAGTIQDPVLSCQFHAELMGQTPWLASGCLENDHSDDESAEGEVGTRSEDGDSIAAILCLYATLRIGDPAHVRT